MEWMETLHTLIGEEGMDIAWWQMTVRGSLIFFYGLVLVRFAHKRVFGKWSALDIVLSVIIGSNLSRALTGSAPFLETLAATTVLVALHSLLASAAARWDLLGPVLKGNPAKLIDDGQVDQQAMRKHGVGEHDLQSALRCAGVGGPEEVRAAYIERSGEISVLKRA